MYLLQSGGRGKVRVTLFGSGTILREVLAAAELLEKDYGVPADVYSVTSFSELRKNALDIERWNLLHPTEPAQADLHTRGARRPARAVHRRHRLHEDRCRIRSANGYRAGTPCSAPTASAAATRARSCAASSRWIATMSSIAALKALADDGKIDVRTVTKAMQAFGIDPEKPNPLSV